MSTYTTIQGDTWDVISKKIFDDVKYTGNIMMANLRYHRYFTFPAGITLQIPDVDATQTSASVPWKVVSG